MIIVIRISICIGSPNNWRTGRNSKRQARGLNVTSLIRKLTKLPTKVVVHRN